MAEISQRTIAVMMSGFSALGLYYPTGFGKPSLLNPDELYQSLYAMGFPQELLERLRAFGWEFSEILPRIKEGKIYQPRGATKGQWRQLAETRMSPEDSEAMLRTFAVALLKILRHRMERSWELIRLMESLQEDGFDYRLDCGLVEADEISEVREELSNIERAISASKHDQKNVLQHHFAAACGHFVSKEWGASSGEWRKFYEEILRGAWRFTRLHNPEFSSYLVKPPFKDVLVWLENAGFITPNESKAYGSAWGFLSVGSHPGIAESEVARLCRFQAVSMGSALLMKIDRWDGSRFSA